MKAVIPVAGAGTKLRPHTYTQPKALIPLAGKTILAHIVDSLLDAGIKEYIFIIGYLGEKIEEYIKTSYPHLNAQFVWQKDRNGSGEAIALTKEYVQNHPIIIVLGDTIVEYDLKDIIKSKQSIFGIKKVDNPQDFGVAEIDDLGIVQRVVEKPAIPKSNFALVGMYKIIETHLLFECLFNNLQNGDDLYTQSTLTDALQCMIEKGVMFNTFKVENWFDCGKKESLLESNAILMKKAGSFVSEETITENTIIVPPVSISKGVVIKNSVIGPNVSIGENTSINHSIIKDSIIGSYTNLDQIVLYNSLVGSDSDVKGISRNLNIGDNTAIDLGGK